MPVEVAQAVLNITPSMRGLQALIDREMRGVNSRRAGQQAAEGYTSGFGGSIKNLTRILGGAFAGVAAVKFGKSIVDQASDMVEVGTKMQVVFGDANGAVQEFASKGAKALGMSSLEAQNAAASFGVFGKSAGLAGKDQADFSTGMAQLAVDMASFSNTSPEDAIEALSAGLRGESEPLRRYGVLLDDATLRNEALAMGLITTTKNALTPQQKVLASHSVIMKQTTDAQGDFARTSGGLANQQRILSAQWADMKGKLGAAFLPMVTSVVSTLNDKLFPAMDSLRTKASGAWDILAHGEFKGKAAGLGQEDSPLVNALFTARETFLDVKPDVMAAWDTLLHGPKTGDFARKSPLIDFAESLRNVGLDVFSKLRDIWDQLWSMGEKLWPSIESIGKSLFEAWQKINGSGWSAFSLVFDAIKLAIDGLITVLNATLVPALEWLAKFFRENPDQILILVGAFTAWKLVTIGTATATWAVEAATKAWTFAQKILNQVMKASTIGLIIAAIAALAAGVVWAYQNVDWFREAVDNVWKALKTAWGWISDNAHLVPDAFAAIWEAAQPVVEFVKRGFGAIKEIIQGLVDFVVGVFTGDWSRAWEGVKKVLQGVWDWISNIIGTGFKMLFALAGKFVEWGGQLIGWVKDGVVSAAVALWDWFKTLPARLWSFISAVWQTAIDWGTSLLNWVWDGIKAVAVQVWDWFKTLPDRLWSAISALWNVATDWGTSLFNWVWDGIKAVAVQVWDWFRTVPDRLWSAISTLWQGASQWGWDLVTWIWQGTDGNGGIKGGASAIWDFFKNLPEEIGKIVVGLASKLLQIGKDLVAKIVEGVTSVASSIWDAITGALTGESVPGGNLPVPLPGNRDGGLIGPQRRANGGAVWSMPGPGLFRGVGGPRDDKNPTLISDGEYIVNAASTAKHFDLIQAINADRRADGGLVGAKNAAYKAGQSLAWEEAKKVIAELKSRGGGGSFGSNGNWGPGTDGSSFAANTLAAKNFITQKWGITDIGGLYGGSVPGSDHPIGKALDVMIANYLSQQGIALGTSVADWFVANPNSFGTKYVIWRDRINEGGSWAPYQHPSGSNDTLQHRDHVHLSFLTGSGNFQGQAVGDSGGGMSSIISKILGKIGGVAASINDVPGTGVERWRSLATHMLEVAGQSPSWANDLLMQMDHESSGRPDVANLIDSNATVLHDPSIGLMQVIGSTFRNTLAAHGFSSYIPLGQTNPAANILASILYTVDRYGDLGYWRRNGFGAYDQGGWLQPGGGGVNLLSKPEAVLTPTESSAYLTHAKALADGYGGRVVKMEVSFKGDGVITNEMTKTAKYVVLDALDSEGFQLDTMAAQS